MSKNTTPADRIKETINYISRLDGRLANRLTTGITGQAITTIGNDISLQVFAMHMSQDKRHALRAILLCQRHFFRPNRPTWKATSLNHWKSKNKEVIDDAILLFTATCNSATRLADVAEAMGKAPLDTSADARLKLSSARGQAFNIGGGICYQALMAWLLQSGLVSFPWFLHFSNVTTPTGLRNSMGTHQEIWDKDTPFTEESHLRNIPRGYIVHFYDTIQETYGHWMISLGDGTGVGCNNHPYQGFSEVQYSNRASLDGQFYHRYKQPGQKGVAYVYNPEAIPERDTLNI